MARTSIYATVDPTTVAPSLQAAAAAGQAVFHVRRQDGTLRRMAYLPPGSADRRAAERVEKMRAKNIPMKTVAARIHVSVPTVRRMINNLELSKHVEAGDMNYVMELCESPAPRRRTA